MLLLIGPTLSDHPSSIGGTTQSFELMRRDFVARGVRHAVVSTNRSRGPGALVLNALQVLLLSAVQIPRAQRVMLNANPRGATVLGPLLYLLCRLWRKPFVFRMFGGDLIEVYEGLSPRGRRLFERTVLRADLVLLQTRALVDYFSRFTDRIRWLPTSREPHGIRRPPGPYRRRLVFVGSVRRSKGIDWVLRFQRDHASTHEVHVYGPIAEPQYESLVGGPVYRGVLKPDQVVSTLAGYDLLLLPTEHPGEGYPGVVIEANSVGVPVVATRWMSLPELVLEGRTGYLTPTGDYPAFEARLLGIDAPSYERLSEAAWRHAQGFQTTEVYARMLEHISDCG